MHHSSPINLFYRQVNWGLETWHSTASLWCFRNSHVLGWQKPSFYKHHSYFSKRIRSGWLGWNVQLVTIGAHFFQRALCPLMNSPFSLNILWSVKSSPASLLFADCCLNTSTLCCYWTDIDARTSVSTAATAASAIAHLKSEAQGGSEDRCLFYSSFLIFVGSQHTKQVCVLQEERPFLHWH